MKVTEPSLQLPRLVYHGHDGEVEFSVIAPRNQEVVVLRVGVLVIYLFGSPGCILTIEAGRGKQSEGEKISYLLTGHGKE